MCSTIDKINNFSELQQKLSLQEKLKYARLTLKNTNRFEIQYKNHLLYTSAKNSYISIFVNDSAFLVY